MNIDTAAIAALFGVQRRYVTDVMTKDPRFPKPTLNVNRRMRRWDQDEVLAFASKPHGRKRVTTAEDLETVRQAARQFEGVEGCWPWPGSTNQGYGRIAATGAPAHRVSYEAFTGPIPDGLFVLHKCDNRPCFNPACLFTGTNKNNMDDMRAKGRGVGQPNQPGRARP